MSASIQTGVQRHENLFFGVPIEKFPIFHMFRIAEQFLSGRGDFFEICIEAASSRNEEGNCGVIRIFCVHLNEGLSAVCVSPLQQNSDVFIFPYS